MSNGQIDGFDQDFLWLFNKIEDIAICLSLNHQILEISSKALWLFQVQKTTILQRPIGELFAKAGLKISLLKDKLDLAINPSKQKNALGAKEAKEILNLPWRVQTKFSSSGKAAGLIIYVEKSNTAWQHFAVDQNKSNQQQIEYSYLETAANHLPGNLYWLDKNRRFLGCSENLLKFFGVQSKQEILGKSYEELAQQTTWITKYLSIWQQNDQKVLATGCPQIATEEFQLLMPDGSEIFYAVSRYPVFAKDSKVIGVVVIIVDISPSRLLKKLQKEKSNLTKELDYMLLLSANIAHEVKAPLAIVALNVDLLTMNPRVTEVMKEFAIIEKNFNNIRYAVKLASSTIGNILVMLKTLSNKGLMKSRLVQLSILDDLNDSLANYPFLEHEKSLIQLRTNLGDDFTYQGDKILTQQLLFNLLKYSLRAIKVEGKGRIVITFGKKKRYHVLKVSHTACGVANDLLPNMFDKFGTESGNVIEDSGLGLAFCKTVMQLYGGTIICRSKQDLQTEFVLSFPK